MHIPRRLDPVTASYTATRVTYDSAFDFAVTRARFDEQVPLLDPTVAVELVVSGAPWAASALSDLALPDSEEPAWQFRLPKARGQNRRYFGFFGG